MYCKRIQRPESLLTADDLDFESETEIYRREERESIAEQELERHLAEAEADGCEVIRDVITGELLCVWG